MKEGNTIYIHDLRIKEPDKSIIYGRIKDIKENEDYIDMYLNTGYKVTIDKREK